MNTLIKTEKEYDEAMARHLKLMLSDPKPGSKRFDELELLTLLIQTYEEANVEIAPPSPVEAIKFRMEQAGLKQKDLVELLGGKSRVSEVLNGKRPLTLEMIRNLHRELGIPLKSLISENTVTDNTQRSADDFPVKDSSQITHTQTFKKGLLQQMFV